MCMQHALHVRAGQGDRDPYWSRPWPAATALARGILQRPDLTCGQRVCEIGAGLGIASIAAAMAGALPILCCPPFSGRGPAACSSGTLHAAEACVNNPGWSCGRAGAREVVMTDREPLALQCGLMRAQASGVAGEADTLAALQLLDGQALKQALRVSSPCPWHGGALHFEHAVTLACAACPAGQGGAAGLDAGLRRPQV